MKTIDYTKIIEDKLNNLNEQCYLYEIYRDIINKVSYAVKTNKSHIPFNKWILALNSPYYGDFSKETRSLSDALTSELKTLIENLGYYYLDDETGYAKR